ncbi:GDP-mannose 4,6-dehydratase [Methanolobus halotolerans]|uniref:Epimerase n=1 Tax=Methanolobus halotolerans TaxID=2052935 RepID=A0A4E0Q6U9_9EURY|nr:GDP-mannose 4,6-dehydratase [Methanolobus halotolerans]TGC10617.1 epimerase [Methanolobus halotolerans]
MTVLLTGCAGFIGSHVLDKLISMNEKVIGVDNFDPYYDPSIKYRNIEHNLNMNNFVLYDADIRNIKEMNGIFKDNRIDTVIHLAAKAGVRPSIDDPVLYEDVNIKGTLNLLELGRKYDIDNLVFASSSSVYGANEKVPFSEEDCVDWSISPYAASKKACETFCYTYHHLYDLPVVCLRFFTVYGPRQRPEMATHKFTRLIDEGQEIEMYGNGTSRRDYTYIDDIVEGIIHSAEIKEGYEIINLGNSEVVELRYLIKVIEESLGKKARIRQLPDQPGDVPITYADISKARSLIGYNPQVKIEEGIRRFVEWYISESATVHNSTFVQNQTTDAVQSADDAGRKEESYEMVQG